MKKFKKRLKIEDAEKFRLEYFEGGAELKKKEFSSYKAMEQFHGRQRDFIYLDYHRYAFIDGNWHRFIKLQSPIVFQREVDFINEIFNENFEDVNLQNCENEESFLHEK
jgi:hypothetical protein